MTSCLCTNSELALISVVLCCFFGVSLVASASARNVGQYPTCGRPAEYRWRSLFNAAVWLTPPTRVRAVRLPRRETRWNLQGCPKLPDRSQPLVGRSSPYCADIWRRYCCLTSFFPIVDTCLSCEDIASQLSHISTIGKKLVKQQYLLHTSS